MANGKMAIGMIANGKLIAGRVNIGPPNGATKNAHLLQWRCPDRGCLTREKIPVASATGPPATALAGGHGPFAIG
jgi:hypothetical protein